MQFNSSFFWVEDVKTNRYFLVGQVARMDSSLRQPTQERSGDSSRDVQLRDFGTAAVRVLENLGARNEI